MISVNLIERFFHGKRFEQLLDNLASNGMDVPLPLHIRLAQVNASPVALGLRRVLELTYGPTPLSRQMTDYLLSAQEPDGSFGHDSLATAAAVAALGKLLAERNHQICTGGAGEEGWGGAGGTGGAGGAAEVAHVRDRALAALTAMQDQDGLFNAPADRTQQDRALTAAFILLLLVRDDQFRQAVRSAELFDWFEQHQDQLEPQTRRLWTMASVGNPMQPPPSPVLAAIAA